MKLIDKDKIVLEIERRKKELIELNNDFANQWACASLDNILSFINTIELKDVDLEKEFYDFLDTLIGKDNGHLSEDELFRIAEYFYELGLKAK